MSICSITSLTFRGNSQHRAIRCNHKSKSLSSSRHKVEVETLVDFSNQGLNNSSQLAQQACFLCREIKKDRDRFLGRARHSEEVWTIVFKIRTSSQLAVWPGERHLSWTYTKCRNNQITWCSKYKETTVASRVALLLAIWTSSPNFRISDWVSVARAQRRPS